MYYIYILTNKRNTVLYVGVSGKLRQRIQRHKTKYYKGFTAKYNIDKLVYFEAFPWVHTAIAREKQIKSYRREKKEALINAFNPEWKELIAPD